MGDLINDDKFLSSPVNIKSCYNGEEASVGPCKTHRVVSSSHQPVVTPMTTMAPRTPTTAPTASRRQRPLVYVCERLIFLTENLNYLKIQDSHPSLQRSFYILIFGILPGSVLLYNFSRNPYNPITALLAKYSDYKDTWEQRNTLHTRMVEQAGHDRNLFLNTPDRGYQDLTFPEYGSSVTCVCSINSGNNRLMKWLRVFNVGSQIAVPAGHGSANLDKLIAHYKEKAFTEEEEKMQKMKEGKLPGQTSWNGF